MMPCGSSRYTPESGDPSTVLRRFAAPAARDDTLDDTRTAQALRGTRSRGDAEDAESRLRVLRASA
jgi:hypothetical protein